MRILCFGTFSILFVSAMLFVPEAQAAGTDYYVAPNGSGSSCTRQSPCSLATGLSKAMAGDEVVLSDGVYRGLRTKRSGTSGSPIVIRAENRHKAVIEWPYSNHRFGQNVDIHHSNIVIRNLKIDGKKVSWDLFRINGTDSNHATNLVVENNWIVDGGHAAIMMLRARNVVIRHNLIENMGQWSEDGEGFYLSSSNGNAPVVNVEIYGNVIRNITANFIDYKGQARNVNVHHNIFEQHRDDKDGWCGDGLVRSQGSNSAVGNYFQDNIVRNCPDVCYMIRLGGNRVDILNNVFYNIGGNRIYSNEMMSGFVITGNTFCDTPTSGSSKYGSNNRFNAPQSDCDTKAKRILNEMAQLPGKSSGTATLHTKSPSSLRIVGTRD